MLSLFVVFVVVLLLLLFTLLLLVVVSKSCTEVAVMLFVFEGVTNPSPPAVVFVLDAVTGVAEFEFVTTLLIEESCGPCTQKAVEIPST
uniref:Uncharacterized protein n=1 Tax=Lepeophtheirus salmonis TaxID=72036 RepID=A0A0K2U0Z7_LEPSM